MVACSNSTAGGHGWLMPLGFCLTGLVIAFHPMLFSGFGLMMVEPVDTRFNGYVLEHSFRWVTRDPLHRDFWSPPIFHPVPNTAAYSDVLLGVAPFYWLWRLVGFAPDTSFQLWMLTVSALNFLVAYRIASRGLNLPPLASSASAFIFAFGSSRLAQLGHQQLLPHFYSLIALYAVVATFRAQAAGRPGATRLWILVCLGGITAQLWSGYYLGWFLAVTLGLGAICALLLPECRPALLSITRQHAAILALGVGVSACLLAPMVSHYLQAAGSVPQRKLMDVYHTMPTWNLWLHVGRENWLYGWTIPESRRFLLQYEQEKQLGFGFLTLATALAGFWRERDRPGLRVLLLVALTVVLLTQLMSHDLDLVRWYFNHVPGAYSVRVVARVGLMMLVPACVGVGYFVHRAQARWQPLLLWAIVAIVLLEQGRQSPAFDKHAARARIAALAREIPDDVDAFVLTRRDGSPAESLLQLDAMWAGLAVNKPTLNGYSGNHPLVWPLAEREARDRRRLRGLLERWRRVTESQSNRLVWIEIDDEGVGHVIRLTPER